MDGKPESPGVGLQMSSAKYQLTFGQHQLVPGSISFLLLSFSSTAGQHIAESTIEENTSNKLCTLILHFSFILYTPHKTRHNFPKKSKKLKHHENCCNCPKF